MEEVKYRTSGQSGGDFQPSYTTAGGTLSTLQFRSGVRPAEAESECRQSSATARINGSNQTFGSAPQSALLFPSPAWIQPLFHSRDHFGLCSILCFFSQHTAPRWILSVPSRNSNPASIFLWCPQNFAIAPSIGGVTPLQGSGILINEESLNGLCWLL